MPDHPAPPAARASEVRVSTEVVLGNGRPFVLIAGLNVLESRELALRVAESLRDSTARLGIPFVFKASFDKANRSSTRSFRGPGLHEGLSILAMIRQRFGVPVLTDVHDRSQVGPTAEVADVIQIPAFLGRQTDLLEAACETARPLHVKKMQMMAPADVENIARKCEGFGNGRIVVCERGTSFGYGNLIVDPLAFPQMKALGLPVTFDVTHALQLPGGLGTATAGRGHLTEPLAIAGMSQGIAGLFLECHPSPEHALCDGPCAMPLARVHDLLVRIQAVDRLVKSTAFATADEADLRRG
jgi:2-dehydro-3-deoxyphosphooctonate aldolase (KDO 8-P synthase)